MSTERLSRFTHAFTRLIDEAPPEDVMLQRGGKLLAELVGQDDWLEDRFAAPGAQSYRQYLLYCDPRERFSVVSFVWGPGQKTPVHDHTVWGLIGVLRGAEVSQDFTLGADGGLIAGARHRLNPGQITAVSPTIGDIHTVENALTDRVSVSIHVYGADIGKVSRTTFDPVTGQPKTFVSAYSQPDA
jgi:predicted metal-dependent enzyme (double-stranded beta helix superfamily)